MRALRVLTLLSAFSALTLTTQAAHAAAPPWNTIRPVAYQLSQQDQVFLERAHQNNMTEIVAGELAVLKGQCVKVRELGAQLVAHHLDLDAEVIAVAARHRTPLPQSPAPDQTVQLSDVSKRTGRDFDITWLRFAVITHVQALQLGDQEILLGQAPDVKQLAVKAQPVLRHHLDQAIAAWNECTQSVPAMR